MNIYYDHNYVKKTFLYCKKSKMLISLYLKSERIIFFFLSTYLYFSNFFYSEHILPLYLEKYLK